MSDVEQNVPSMTVKYGVGPVSLRTVGRHRRWSVQGVVEQEQQLPLGRRMMIELVRHSIGANG